MCLSTFCPQGSQKELLNLTQQDYVNRIEELNQSLKDAWASDQKVKALKIVIQVRLSEFFFFLQNFLGSCDPQIILQQLEEHMNTGQLAGFSHQVSGSFLSLLL